MESETPRGSTGPKTNGVKGLRVQIFHVGDVAGERSGWRGKKPLRGTFSAGPLGFARVAEDTTSDSESEHSHDSVVEEVKLHVS